MSEPVTIELRKPISFGKRTVEKLTFRPLKAKDLRRLKESESNIASALNFASYLSGEESQIIDELEGQDLRDVIEVVNGFFLSIRGTGEKSSES